METIQISLDIANLSHSQNICIELRIDDQKFFDSVISPGTHHVVHEFAAPDGDHCLYIVMKGKTAQDTCIDVHGHIVSDSVIDICNICLDKINIDQLVSDFSQYRHDTNGTTDAVVDRFHGTMGCNGYVTMRFGCPSYLWLLETM